MNADEHRLIAFNAVCKMLRLMETDEDLTAEQYVKALREVEEQAMIARMAMQRVVDIERESKAPDATTPAADDDGG